MSKLIVAVDLDGVLADYSQGWQGLDKIGPPIPGAVEFTHELGRLGYRVVIHTCRCSISAQAELTGIRETLPYLVAPVRNWLIRHEFYFNEIHTDMGKPLASAYIDDNAYRCTPMSDPQAYGKILRDLARTAIPPGSPPAGVRSFGGSPDPAVQGLNGNQIVGETTLLRSQSRSETFPPVVVDPQAGPGPHPSSPPRLLPPWLERQRSNSLSRDPEEQYGSTAQGE